ncbi:MAG: DsbA family oxidoreductase [Anaerolineales bacterium]|nr:MAG: DsbA family oxidoreductase [Anaerolineales bacterium]
MKIDIWSDIACPFCYAGTTQLNQALANFEHKDQVQIVHHSFQLDPSSPFEPQQSINAMLAAKRGITEDQADQMNQQVGQMFASLGLSMNHHDAKLVNTLHGHRLVHFAAAHGKQAAMLARLFKAYFTDGLNTADTETLVQLAGEVGLDPGAARAALESDAYTAEVQADINQAAQYGIQGVPFFIFDNKYAISGAQGAEAFGQTLDQVWQELHAAAA